MTGEEKNSRSKRCLSRSKRSKPQKLADNDACPEAIGIVYTAIKSKQTECLRVHGRVTDHLENEDEDLSEENIVNYSKVEVLGEKSRNHTHDAFEFYDEDDNGAVNNDDATSVCVDTCSNKRKRIDSEEIEFQGITKTISRFKRARNAVSNLNQPLLLLQKCAYSRKSKLECKRTGESVKGIKESTDIKDEPTRLGSLHQLEEDHEEIVLESEKGNEVSNLPHVESKARTDLSQQALELLDEKPDSTRNQVCPVCGSRFSPTDSMDIINQHINSCLDKGTAHRRITENDLSEPAGESIREDLFFCQLCQKDLSKMNSQRRQQHMNRCCDQTGKAEEMPQVNDAQSQASKLLQCPICGKGFKSTKTRQSHLKKCAQEYNVGTNQLLEIVHREQQQEDSTSAAAVGTEVRSAVSSASGQQGSITRKRKRRGVKPKDDLDEETQIALALSASMAPPPPPDQNGKKSVRRIGKKNKGGNELPPLLLRDDEMAQRAVAIRAAQVLCTQDDDDDEISCTPALVPSRLAQNVPGYLPQVPVCDAHDKPDSASTSDNPMEENSEFEMPSDEGEKGFKEATECYNVDPELSRSFLNFLYDVDVEEKSEAEVKVPRPSPLWSLAALKEQPSDMFYVPDLLPPISPQRCNKLTKKTTPSKMGLQNEHAPIKLNGQAVDTCSFDTNEDRNLEGPKKTCTAETDECPEITPSQAADVEMLMELAGEDDISNMSVGSQHMMTASGFCVDEQEDMEFKRTDSLASGVPKLLQDLSSMINNPYLSDVIFKLKDGHEMVAHGFILSLRSESLAQLLSQQRALSNKTASCGPWPETICLTFDNVQQSAFETVLRYIYTGDIAIPEECELDEITNLAERFKLPCLLKACKATREQLNQVRESQEDDGIDDCVAATDLDKLEENLWRNDNEDEFSNYFQTSKNKADEDNFLNDDDIEEIMLFQTQSLRRKESQECEIIEKRQSPLVQRITDEERISSTDVVSIAEQKNDGDREKSVGSFGDEGLSLIATEKGNLSHNPAEEDNLSRDPNATISPSHNFVEKGNLSQDPAFRVNLTRSHVAKDTLSLNFVENTDSTPLCGDIERETMDEKQDESTYFQEKHILTRDNGWLSRDCEEKEMIKSLASGNEPTCVHADKPIRDSEDVETQPQDHVQGDRDGELPAGRRLELSDVNDDAGIGFESENNADFDDVSIDLLNDKTEDADGDVNKLDDADEIPETLSDFPPLETEGRGLPLPAGEERWDVEHDLWGSPREVTLLDDDEVEEIAANESITLISDNDDEVILDASPPKTNITIVPETPRVPRSSLQSVSSKSSSTTSVSEEDGDVSLVGSSPSKTRKQLKDEADQFLSKLKERVGRGKGKKRGKEKTKKSSRKTETLRDSFTKYTTPTKQSPRGRQEHRIDTSPLSSGVRTSPRGFQPQDASPMGQSPEGFKAWSNSPMRDPPRDFETRKAAPILVQEGCVSDLVTVEHSPPLSPVLVEPDSPHRSQVKRKAEDSNSSPCATDLRGTERKNPGNNGVTHAQNLDFEDPGDVEIADIAADKTDANLLPTCSSPQDVMSPPVPSPEYSFMDRVSCPGSPVPCASPQPQKIALSPVPVSPSVPVDWKSPASESGLGASPQSNSPMSPSVCSFSSQIPVAHTQSGRGDLVRKLDLEKSLSDKEMSEAVEVKEFDPSVPLIQRLRAARGGRKIFNVDEESSDNNSDDVLTKDEICSEHQKSPLILSRQDEDSNGACEIKEIENIAMDADFDFYDDGGYNFDIEELNQLEDCLEGDDVETYLDKHEESHSTDDKSRREEKGAKVVAGKRKVPLSQRRIEDSDDNDKTPEVPKKRGKKTDSQSHKVTGQTVSQPVTPMPRYNDMATPDLKVELNKFGVRPLPKKKMILKLKEIYDYTHQVEPPAQESKTEHAANVANPLPSSAVVSHTGGEIEGSGTASSDDSDEENTEFGDCTVMIEDEAITASQQVNGGNLKEKLFSYIRNNKELYKTILKYQPVELVSLHRQVKSDGINCSLGKFVDFLDEQCITFTTAGSRTRAPRKQGGKKKINKKT